MNYRTKTGRLLTEADIAALADEAERGYDPADITPQTRVWTRDRMYFVILANGVEFAIDEFGNAVKWSAQPGENIGRRITTGDVPEPQRKLIELAERTGLAPVQVAE
jgi:hypothetical protein